MLNSVKKSKFYTIRRNEETTYSFRLDSITMVEKISDSHPMLVICIGQDRTNIQYRNQDELKSLEKEYRELMSALEGEEA